MTPAWRGWCGTGSTTTGRASSGSPRELGTHPSHLVRVFRREYGLPPHRYVVGRRLDRARPLLLAGMPIADVAAATGFHDQSHLTRHFRALLGTTPGAFRSAA